MAGLGWVWVGVGVGLGADCVWEGWGVFVCACVCWEVIACVWREGESCVSFLCVCAYVCVYPCVCPLVIKLCLRLSWNYVRVHLSVCVRDSNSFLFINLSLSWSRIYFIPIIYSFLFPRLVRTHNTPCVTVRHIFYALHQGKTFNLNCKCFLVCRRTLSLLAKILSSLRFQHINVFISVWISVSKVPKQKVDIWFYCMWRITRHKQHPIFRGDIVASLQMLARKHTHTHREVTISRV